MESEVPSQHFPKRESVPPQSPCGGIGTEDKVSSQFLFHIYYVSVLTCYSFLL